MMQSMLKRSAARATATARRAIYTPSERTLEFIAREDAVSAHNYHPLPVVLTKGRGCKVWDVDGKEYFDFLAGYSALNQGHCHPRIVAALLEQAQTLTLTSRAFHNDTFADYCETITRTTGYERVLPINTGAEAIETAAKIARKWAYEVKGIAPNAAKLMFASENFHGRTMTAVSASTDPECREHFGPYITGVRTMPYSDESVLERELSDPTLAAVMIEPIQGEAGVVLPHDGYLRKVRELCTKYNVLMVSDEVQAGLGRTGYMVATEHEGVRPDMVTFGKALSGGVYPVAAVVCDSHVMDVITPGTHGSTYGGNPLGNRVAVESLRVLEEEGMLENSVARGEQLRSGLRSALPSSLVREVRGRGLMNAIEINDHGDDKAAWKLCLHFAEQGLLAKPTHGDRIRFTPPLVITEKEVDQCLEKIQTAVRNFQAAGHN